MDIDKILRSQISATDVLRQQTRTTDSITRMLTATDSAHFRALKGSESLSTALGLAQTTIMSASALQLSASGLSRSSMERFVMGGATDQVYKRVMAAAFAPPEMSWHSAASVSSSLASLFKAPEVYGLSEALAQLTSTLPATYGVSEAVARLMGPADSFNGMSGAMARLMGHQQEFTNTASRLADLFATEPFSTVGRASVRDRLGDWRDPISFRPNLELPATRLGLYFDQGMSEDILDVPANDSALQDYVATALLDIEDDGNVAAYRLLMHLEYALRRLIQIALEEIFGPKWWKQQVPPDVREKCEEKLRDAVAAGAADTHPIDYADFTDYEKIICRSDNFKQAFEPIFGRAGDVRESLQRLHPVRLICMHSRIVTGADLVLVQFEAPRILARVKTRLK